jgi:hypothetical protein
VNGNENIYFKANPDEVSELLDLFSKARLRDHEVKIEFGKPTVSSFAKQSFEYNVKVELLSGIALFMLGRNDDARTLEPSMTIYLDADGALLGQIKIPENITVTSTAALPEIKVKRTLPQRKALFGRIQFDDGDEANGMERGISTRVTFWEKDSADGIELSRVDREGRFKLVLSDQEIAAIKNGDAWLTTTTGNFITKAKKEDAKFPFEKLTEQKDKVEAQKIPAPKYYWGRIRFDDGTPPVLNPPPWPGADINVSFPYAGQARLDAEGYFQVYFEPQQLEELIKRRPQKNIYIPEQEQGRSRAQVVFPPQLLSQDKSKAGEVKIPKPQYTTKK